MWKSSKKRGLANDYRKAYRTIKDSKVFPIPSNTVCNDSLKRIPQPMIVLKKRK